MTTDVFTASGTFTPPAGVTSVDVLIVAGGGSGGKSARGGGGGGGGGVRLDLAVAVTPGVGVAVTVGAGGAAPTVALTNGNNGGNSAFGALTATGGGGGGGASPATGPAGGSGGGGAGGVSGVTNAGGAGTAGQGTAGGNGRGNAAINGRSGGGGGGKDAVGGAGASGQVAGAGGAGHDYTATVGAVGGAAGFFGGGGGGGRTDSAAGAESVGGAGGGGAGGGNSAVGGHSANGTNGTANTGGGGGGSGTTAGGGAGSDGAAGAGGSGVVVVVYTIPPPVPSEAYRVVVEVGSHTYDVTAGDPPDYGVTLPLTWGWQIPESVEFFPTQANPTTGSFGLVVPTVADVDDLAVGDPVTVEVYVPSDAATPWQATRGVVTQLDATVGDRNRVTVYFSDPTVLLADKVVGLGAWPLENVFDRLGRICAEAGVTFDYAANEASGGLLPARGAGATDALSAIRNALKDDADRNTSYAGTTIYGRTVYAYDPDLATLFVLVTDRSVTSWPAILDVDGHLAPNPAALFGGGLDGCAVTTDGRWARLPGDRYAYVIVDGLLFDADGVIVAGPLPGVPYVRNTGFVDGPGPAFPSATARAYLGRSLLPIPDEGAPGWRTDVIRHLSYLDPDPVTGWLGGSSGTEWDFFPWVGIHHVIVTPVDPTLTLDGRGWITGTLTAARLVIPPGGDFYVDVTLRPTLFPVDKIRTPTGAARWQDIDAAVSWSDLDPLLTWRDLTVAAQP